MQPLTQQPQAEHKQKKREYLKRIVRRYGVVRLSELTRLTGEGADTISELITEEETGREVECLFPVRASSHDPDHVFLRWRQPDDRAYLWQVKAPYLPRNMNALC